MVGATTISTLVVVIPSLNDWVTTILESYLRVSTIANADMIGEIVLT
jgi:hypothetical protein